MQRRTVQKIEFTCRSSHHKHLALKLCSCRKQGEIAGGHDKAIFSACLCLPQQTRKAGAFVSIQSLIPTANNKCVPTSRGKLDTYKKIKTESNKVTRLNTQNKRTRAIYSAYTSAWHTVFGFYISSHVLWLGQHFMLSNNGNESSQLLHEWIISEILITPCIIVVLR